MKNLFDRIDNFPSDSFGPIHFAPPTFMENLAGAAFTLILLLSPFVIVGGVAWGIMQILERRERTVR